MLLQILIGAGLLLATTIISVSALLLVEIVLTRRREWLLKPPHTIKMVTLLCGAVVWFLLIISAAVWIWAIAFLGLGLFETAEEAVYFSIVSFTTLGFGDVLLPKEWQLLSGMASINGLLMIGFQTAMLIEVLRRVRSTQNRIGSDT